MTTGKEYLKSKLHNKERHINYVLCATQRTGSTLICEVLENLDLLQFPENFYEALHSTHKEEDLYKNTPLEEYLSTWLEEFNIDGVSGFKIMASHLIEHVLRAPGITPQNAISLFPENTYFIWIKRRDKLRQAVSMRRAVATKIWRKLKKNENKNSC